MTAEPLMAWLLMALFFGGVAMFFLAIIWLFVRRPFIATGPDQ